VPMFLERVMEREPVFGIHGRVVQMTLWAAILCGGFLPAVAQDGAPVHGLWVWKGPSVVEAPHGAEELRDFCRAQGVNEIFISMAHGDTSVDPEYVRLIELLHREHIRVEALLSSTDADEEGAHREKLLDHVREVIQFNAEHAHKFDGVHLDIEPQQRPENKGAGNLKFLPGLVAAYHDVRALAEPAGLTVNADIQNKLLKGSLDERQMLMSSLPRLTLMMYEISNPTDSEEQKLVKVRSESAKYLAMAYDGLSGGKLARMVIGLRTPDYGAQMPVMLKALDEANGANPHYNGWAWHDYADGSQAMR
jgi:hypothetical protein